MSDSFESELEYVTVSEPGKGQKWSRNFPPKTARKRRKNVTLIHHVVNNW